MQNISTVAELRNTIRLLENERAYKGQLFKEQLSVVYESLMPINIFKSTLKKIFGKTDMIDNLSGSAFGIVSGLLLKRVFIGTSGNNFRKLIGSFLQMGISKIVSQNSDVIRSVGHGIIQYLFQNKPSSARNRVG
jgi:hypothetical protein